MRRQSNGRSDHADANHDAAFAAAEQLYRSTFDQLPIGLAVASLEGTIVDVNPAWARITRHPEPGLVGCRLQDVFTRNTPRDGALGSSADPHPSDWATEALWRCGDDHEIWIHLTVSVVRDRSQLPTHLVGRLVDITDAKAAHAAMQEREQELRHDATHDHLTGLANRAMVEEHVQVAIDRSARDSGQAAVLAIDIDSFKSVNDTWGHQCGDQALVEVARRLSAECRSGDIVGRFGGDEFVVVTAPMSDDDRGRHLANRIVTAIARPMHLSATHLRVTVSVGVTVIGPADTIGSVLDRADRASYMAKSRGGNDLVAADRR